MINLGQQPPLPVSPKSSSRFCRTPVEQQVRRVQLRVKERKGDASHGFAVVEHTVDGSELAPRVLRGAALRVEQSDQIRVQRRGMNTRSDPQTRNARTKTIDKAEESAIVLVFWWT